MEQVNNPGLDKEDRLKKIQEEYKNSIPKKIASLKKHIADMKIEMRPETLSAFRMEIHKIAGSAQVYGFAEVSQTCILFEQDIIAKIKELPLPTDKSHWIAEFETYVKKIEGHFTKG